MAVEVPLLIHVWPDVSGNETKRFQASLSGHLRAWFLQVLRSSMPMGTTKGTEMQLQVVVSSHGVGTMDFGSPKEVAVTTFVSAEKLSARKSGPHFAHASHVEGALEKCTRTRVHKHSLDV